MSPTWQGRDRLLQRREFGVQPQSVQAVLQQLPQLQVLLLGIARGLLGVHKRLAPAVQCETQVGARRQRRGQHRLCTTSPRTQHACMAGMIMEM